MTSTRFYGVYIPKDNDISDLNSRDRLHVYTSYDEAHKVIKEFKSARFKCFSSREEASSFALLGSASGPGNPNVISEGTPFRSLKRPEIFSFRKHIENNNLEFIEKMAWENPRYLIGVGDTPTIMQEGPRYNALHIAAIHNSYKVAEFILKTVSNKLFTQLLYGAAGDSSYDFRPEIMIDRYLNTPDKGLNETPLHFAAKHGSLEVVEVFIQYPQLQLNVKNKHGETPKDVTCKTFRSKIINKPANDSKSVSWYTTEIHKLLDEPFFVPVWRSNEDVIQPIIGKPYSPKSPPVCPLVSSPLSPVMEIKGVAGPMSFDEAANFHKTWRSPVKSVSSGTPHVSKGILLRSPLECEKSFEKIGRTLARKFHVSWKEYWPFLDKFIDITSPEGLELLENYLKNKINEATQKSELYSFNIKSPMSDLCSAFSSFSIKSPEVQSNKVNDNGDLNSFSSLEKLCSNSAQSILSSFRENFESGVRIDENISVLIKKMKNLSVTINICLQDKAFQKFPFEKLHDRIASSVIWNIKPIEETWISYVCSIFDLIDSTKIADIIHRISFSPSSSNFELENIVLMTKCVSRKVVEHSEIELFQGSNHTSDWSFMKSCYCFDTNNNGKERKFIKSCDVTSYKPIRNNVRKKISFVDDSTDGKSSAFDMEELISVAEVTNSQKNCDIFINPRINGVTNSDNDSDDDLFFTPPSSIYDSDDEMESPEEGPNLFICDNRGTSMDNAVLEAIVNVYIDPERYPSIYRWKHFILLHNSLNRLSWPNPSLVQSI